MSRVHRFSHLISGLLGLTLLCQCAVKHQPTVFEPHFSLTRPDGYSTERLWERKALERRQDLSALEKRRLLWLYRMERDQLAPDHPFRKAIEGEIAVLESELKDLLAELESLAEEVREAEREARQEEEGRIAIETRPLKERYDEAYRLWNEDKNQEALERIKAIVADEELEDEADSDEWYQVWYIAFRIALDAGALEDQLTAYAYLRDHKPCHPKTTTAGFLMALNQFSHGQPDAAFATYRDQCDPDESPAARVKRAYWLARFQEPRHKDPSALYQEVLASRLPDYYTYLAVARLGRKIEFSRAMFSGRSFLEGPLEVSRGVSELWREGERRVKANLRGDAEIYFKAAYHALKDDADDPKGARALLYTAHLLQSAGSQLAAMRIYARLGEHLRTPGGKLGRMRIDFLEEMYPRPFVRHVEGLAAQWNVDPNLVYSLMRQESAFNPRAVSVAGARGLLQIMPFLASSLAEQWGDSDYSDEHLFMGEENLKWAIFHLHQLRHAAPHIALMAASYNAGIHRVSGWWRRFGHLPLDVFVEMVPITETRNYIKLVIRNYLYYRSHRGEHAIRPDAISFQLPPAPAPVGE